MLTIPMAQEISGGRVKLKSLFVLMRSRGFTGLDMFAVEISLDGAKCVQRVLEQNERSVGVGILADSTRIRRKGGYDNGVRPRRQ